RHLFVSDRTEIAGTKLPETKLLLSRSGINRHWNVNQPEANAAFPDRTHTRECFLKALCLSTLTASPPAALCLAEISCNSEKPAESTIARTDSQGASNVTAPQPNATVTPGDKADQV